MPVNLMSTFPLCHRQAVDILVKAPWSPQEAAWIDERPPSSLFHPIGDQLRKHWWLDEPTSPLARYYKKSFQLGDPGNMVSLMLLEFKAHRCGQPIDIWCYVREFQKQWRQQGLDPVTRLRLP